MPVHTSEVCIRISDPQASVNLPPKSIMSVLISVRVICINLEKNHRCWIQYSFDLDLYLLIVGDKHAHDSTLQDSYQKSLFLPISLKLWIRLFPE